MGVIPKEMCQRFASPIDKVPSFINHIDALEKVMRHYQDRIAAHTKRMGIPPSEEEKLKYWDSLAQPIINGMNLSLRRIEENC